MNVSVRKISVSSELGRTFFLKIDSAEDLGKGFAVVLCDGGSAWEGNVSEGDVTREAEEMEMRREKYVQDLQLALIEERQQAGGYAFHLSPDSSRSGVLHLSYEKVQKDISFSLGSVELRTVLQPTEVIKELISHGLERSAKVQASNSHLQEENQRLIQDQEHITAEMERYVRGKETLEKELYTRFVQVLNEKKAKIRGLVEKIRQLQEEQEQEEQRAGPVGKRATPSEREDQGEPSTPAKDEYEGSTDEEQPQTPPRELQRARRAPARELPAHSSVEDSLTDIIDVAPCRKRRQRHLQGPGSQEVQQKESEFLPDVEGSPESLQHVGLEEPDTLIKEPARSKEETNRKAARRAAATAVAIATANRETDDLFDDF